MEIKKRLMAIDYGSRRIGLAVSDAFHLTARPLKAIDQKQETDVPLRLQELIDENEIDELVVGMPFNMDDSEGEAADNVKVFINQLCNSVSCPVHIEDERLSSESAKNLLYETGQWKSVKKNKAKIDSMAAVVILQSYMRGNK